jgi:hypothetical protein
LLGQLEEKNFDYFVFNIVDYGVNCGLLRSGAHRRALAQTIDNVLGARHQLARECGKSPSRSTISSISATRRFQTTLGGSTTTSPPIADMILRQQLNYVIIDYGRADRGAPDKS